MRRLASILMWSAISAAFIGPGTVTTAAAAGASFELALLWALVFSTIACLALQEASARLTVASGLTLGQVLRRRFGAGVTWVVVGSVVLGCAAYEGGNILGAVAGVHLVVGTAPWLLTLATGVLAVAVLLSGAAPRVARVLGALVAVMGVCFLLAALRLGPDPLAVVRGALVPSVPSGGGAVVLALVGTTVVPYNLFLASGLARRQSLAEMRLGLGVAVPLGGLISAAVVVTGTAVEGSLTFPGLAAALAERLGPFAPWLLAVGLFGAGLSSAITAPLAAAMSVRSATAGATSEVWRDEGGRFRAVWLVVLGVGLLLGISGARPIPAIILAQAANGIILPAVAVTLVVACNDRALLGAATNRWLANLAGGVSAAVAVLLGVGGVLRAGAKVLGQPAPDERTILLVAAVVVVLVAIPAARVARRLAGEHR
jgi:Mn2+/Fe2+ NRAMP family transporter